MTCDIGEGAIRLALMHRLAVDINRYPKILTPERPNLCAAANRLGYSRATNRAHALRDLVKLVREFLGEDWEPTGAVARALAGTSEPISGAGPDRIS